MMLVSRCIRVYITQYVGKEGGSNGEVTLTRHHVVLLAWIESRQGIRFSGARSVSVGIKLFTLYLIVGFGNSVVQAIMNQLNALVACGQPVGFGDWLAIAGSALVYGGVGYMVPGIASSMMSGSPSMSLGNNLGAASGMLAAAPVAAGLAAGAATTKAAGLVGKAFGRTQSGAAGGIGGSAASGGGFAGGISGGTAGLSKLTQAAGNVASMAGKDAKATQAVGAEMQNGGDAIKAAQSPTGKDLSGAASPSTVDSKPGGNGFTSAPGTSGGMNETGGMSASGFDANAAQRAFKADQQQNQGKSWADKLLDKSSDLQHAADRKQPGLAHDGSSGSGIGVRIQHHEH